MLLVIPGSGEALRIRFVFAGIILVIVVGVIAFAFWFIYKHPNLGNLKSEDVSNYLSVIFLEGKSKGFIEYKEENEPQVLHTPAPSDHPMLSQVKEEE